MATLTRDDKLRFNALVRSANQELAAGACLV
jgi:hypothetical protein